GKYRLGGSAAPGGGDRSVTGPALGVGLEATGVLGPNPRGREEVRSGQGFSARRWAESAQRPVAGRALILNSCGVMRPSPSASCWSKLRCEYGHSASEIRPSPLVSIVANDALFGTAPIS